MEAWDLQPEERSRDLCIITTKSMVVAALKEENQKRVQEFGLERDRAQWSIEEKEFYGAVCFEQFDYTNGIFEALTRAEQERDRAKTRLVHLLKLP